jgi:hypothetical protein
MDAAGNRAARRETSGPHAPDSADWEIGPFGMKVPPGGRYPDDPSYGFFRGE